MPKRVISPEELAEHNTAVTVIQRVVSQRGARRRVKGEFIRLVNLEFPPTVTIDRDNIDSAIISTLVLQPEAGNARAARVLALAGTLRLRIRDINGMTAVQADAVDETTGWP